MYGAPAFKVPIHGPVADGGGFHFSRVYILIIYTAVEHAPCLSATYFYLQTLQIDSNDAPHTCTARALVKYM